MPTLRGIFCLTIALAPAALAQTDEPLELLSHKDLQVAIQRPVAAADAADDQRAGIEQRHRAEPDRGHRREGPVLALAQDDREPAGDAPHKRGFLPL